MLNGYERATKEVIPAVRLMLVRELNEKYNLKEVEIAERLGIAQAAVSKYLNGKYSERIEQLVGQIDKNSVKKYIEKIANEENISVNKCICTVCNTMNKFNCSFSYADKV